MENATRKIEGYRNRIAIRSNRVSTYRKITDSPASIPFHFFKVILQPSKQGQKLSLPPKFVKKFGKELSNVASLSAPTGRVWDVGLERVDKEFVCSRLAGICRILFPLLWGLLRI
ncbi:hypothetical protein M0R45_035342 [Rubus argutus]|uniref:Uncharacterized protein n=1 Tax=Rubus argutus TaxID=59490 RepID=A0AAW1VVS0_RUBAR